MSPAGEHHKRAHGDAVANKDGTNGGVSGAGGTTSEGGSTGGTTTPVCDADGDGFTDAGADPSCAPAPPSSSS